MKEKEDLTLIILPTKDVERLKLLSKTSWQYVENVSSITHPDDIQDSLDQIKEFYKQLSLCQK